MASLLLFSYFVKSYLLDPVPNVETSQEIEVRKQDTDYDVETGAHTLPTEVDPDVQTLEDLKRTKPISAKLSVWLNSQISSISHLAWASSAWTNPGP